jgi:hypothetical protein
MSHLAQLIYAKQQPRLIEDGNSAEPMWCSTLLSPPPGLEGVRHAAAGYSRRPVKKGRDAIRRPFSEKSCQETAAAAETAWMCKLLIPKVIAGSSWVIDILGSMPCSVKVSAPEHPFPGTKDHTCVMIGKEDAVLGCLSVLLSKLTSYCCSKERIMLRLVIPNSAVGSILGIQGQSIRILGAQTGCRINASPRVPNFQERLLTISGDSMAVANAARIVLTHLQRNSHLQQNSTVVYNSELPLGIWEGEKAKPADPNIELLHPEESMGLNKRELVAYLQKAAPRKVLMRYDLLGKVSNIIKVTSKDVLITAIKETWELRSGNGDLASSVDEGVVPTSTRRKSSLVSNDTPPAFRLLPIGSLTPTSPTSTSCKSKLDLASPPMSTWSTFADDMGWPSFWDDDEDDDEDVIGEGMLIHL